MNKLFMWALLDSDNPRLIGHIEPYRGDGLAFYYNDWWLKNGFAISGDMPLSSLPVFQDRNNKLGAISDALPDNFGEAMIKILHPSSRLSLLERLYYVGDDRFGALGFSDRSDVYHPYDNKALQSFEDIQDVCSILDTLDGSPVMDEHIKSLISSTKSMGGAHPKGLLNHENKSWIVKFPYGSNTDTPLIEHASMTLAKKSGIRVANTFVIPVASGNAVAIERFDRVGKNKRLHTLSADTVFRSGFDAYGSLCNGELSYGGLADIIRTGDYIQDRTELFRRMVFNILIDNTDDHEKNHAFVFSDGSWRLSDAYDILPLASGVGSHQLLIGDHAYEGTFRNAISQHSRFGLSKQDAIEEWKTVAAVVNGWKAHFKACGVTDSDLNYLSEFIDSEDKLALRECVDNGDLLTPARL